MNTTGKFLILNPASTEFDQVLKLDQSDFPKPWSESNWTSLNWDHHILYGWMRGHELSGFVLFAQAPGDDTAHLLKICVATSQRGSGMTQAFWVQCLENLRTLDLHAIYLEVESPNQRAISFYQKSGFKLLRRIKGYYSDGTDALTMRATI